MSTEFLKVEPKTLRDEVVDFFYEQKHWPGAKTRDDYYRMWDWRYTALSDGPPLIYVSRNPPGATITGHIAVYHRRFKVNGVELRVGVPGNLLVHSNNRGGVAGPRLVSFVRSVVRDGIVDMVLPFANQAAHALFIRLGFRDLGRMDTYVDVRKIGPMLGRRFKPAAALGPIVDTCFAIRRFLKQRHLQSNCALVARPIAADEFSKYDRSHWAQAPDRVVAADSNAYITTRFLGCPHIPRTMYGLFRSDAPVLEGYVIVEGSNRLKVWDCQVNSACLGPAQAISRVAQSIPNAESLIVPALPNSELARELVEAGFFQTEPRDYIEQSTFVSAYWLPDHPHAALMENIARWNVWFGSNHY